MATVEKSIDVDVPVSRAYGQWTMFEDFPVFMEGVQRVDQQDDRRLHWVVEVAGRTKEWDAEIIDQQPDRVVAWRSTDGTPQAGAVTFEPLDLEHTRIWVQMSYEPEGAIEHVGDALGIAGRRVQGDLERFKAFVENQTGGQTGWRGRIDHDRPVTDGGRSPADRPASGTLDDPLS